MNAAERRTKITHLLAQANGPLSATALAAQCGVSRQIIVGDVALLRAGGDNHKNKHGFAGGKSGGMGRNCRVGTGIPHLCPIY